MPSFQCSAILFDLDGVLVDSTRSVSHQYRRWAQENGIDPALVLKAAHGVRTVEVVRTVAPHLDAEAETLKIEAREAADIENVYAMPGARELVTSIPDGRWCVVTSGTLFLATTRLRNFGIPIPKVFVTAETVAKGKPDPEPYLTAAKTLGVPPRECLVIEDAPAGIAAARAGGMKVIALVSTYPGAELTGADAVIQTLRNITVTMDGTERNQSLRISLTGS
jgi:sugar-phosphatase